jgi:hypothetical protein
LNDLIAEYLVNYPYLNELLVLFQHSSFIVSRAEIVTRLGTISESLGRRYPEFAHVFEPERVLEVLYAIGFLGVLKQGQASYAFEGGPSVDLSDDTFVVQPSFREALRSTSSIALRPLDLGRLRRRAELEFTSTERFAPVRGRLSSRRLQYVAVRCQAVVAAFMRADVPYDVKAEVRSNLGHVRDVADELAFRTHESDRQVSLFAYEVVEHLRALLSALRVTPVIDGGQARDLIRTLDDAIRDLSRLAESPSYLGTLGDIGQRGPS